jgi:glyoxylase-like metal-dependent hydrolase (beta-lactamase superfamily II)
MTTTTTVRIVPLAVLGVFTLAGTACTASSHATRLAKLGVASSGEAMEALLDSPGPVEIETVTGADWAVPRSGLIDLDNPTAKAAGLIDGDEPIQVYVHVLHHPTRGTFLIDTGLARVVAEDPARAGVGFLVRKAMHPEKMVVRTDTAKVLGGLPQPPVGVLLTHLHLDHISGLPDVPGEIPIFVGPGETRERRFLFLFSRGSIDNLLRGHEALEELAFSPDPSGRFVGVLDLFGDGSVFAISVPGHTAGSVAYVARTPRGPVLLTGDTCHTRWGWEHDVEPGSFSSDRPRNLTSLAALRALAARHPGIDVRLGHQR